ncbi:MAG: MarR family transcriptional regulator [Eubacteriales bacterium]|jgi:DNA-binding MarR family transcriptional regulator|nr:MarR family transcriptional regulator [Eubacteriales bacterium]
MNQYEQEINQLMLEIFNRILVTEEKALSRGEFKDLSVAEMHTLEGIGLYNSRTMSETAAILEITTGTLTVAVDRLVRKGYVARNRDASDRRVVRVCLTRKGKLAYRMHNKFHTLLVDRITEPLSTEQRDVLLTTLKGIAGFVGEQYRRYTEYPEKQEKRTGQPHETRTTRLEGTL